jgi:serine/threonine-protein kinase RIO1
MNISCEPFNSIDVIYDKDRYRRWDKYPMHFRDERLAYIKSHKYGKKVFVHGDLCGDNILLTRRGELYIIDFADAVLAPVVYEHALIAVGLFGFDAALIRGYFGDCSADELAEICFNGMLIHDFGGDIIVHQVGKENEFQQLDDLRNKIRRIITDETVTFKPEATQNE